jgi:cytochrome c6
MKRITVLAVCFLVFTLSGAALAADSPATAGAALFKSKCAMCHGADATGNTPMGKRLNLKDLRSPEIQSQTDAQLTEAITKGRNKMPAFGSKLSAGDISNLVAFVRSLKSK